jgi:cell wall-associated NlpC family hydrolase
MAPRSLVRHQVAAEARRIVDTLKHTKYQHKTHIDEETGTFDVDCSGFVSYVLHRVTPEGYAEIPKEATHNRPRAFKYYEFFASLPGESSNAWRLLENLRQCKRGDIIAWRFKEVVPGKDTGHVLIVAGEPESLTDGNVAVPVYDSAATPHFDDSRDVPGEAKSGVGSGTLVFEVDGDGSPVAVQFSPLKELLHHRIAIGSLVESS